MKKSIGRGYVGCDERVHIELQKYSLAVTPITVIRCKIFWLQDSLFDIFL